MIFVRSVPRRVYADYTRYRLLLRVDFRHRCAYCLRHEFFVGGEAGMEIDHHRPQAGASARPDLVSVYENLYWCCGECNQNKGDTWPTPADYDAGRRFLDPCRAEDDHDRHLRAGDDGTLTPLTEIGVYTSEHLLLWRESLAYHRARCLRWQTERQALLDVLATRAVPEAARAAIESRLAELGEWIAPPVFDRATRRRSR